MSRSFKRGVGCENKQQFSLQQQHGSRVLWEFSTTLSCNGHQTFGSFHSVCFCHTLLSGSVACQSLGSRPGREFNGANLQRLNRLWINSVSGGLSVINQNQTKKNEKNKTKQTGFSTATVHSPSALSTCSLPFFFHLLRLAISFCPMCKLWLADWNTYRDNEIQSSVGVSFVQIRGPPGISARRLRHLSKYQQQIRHWNERLDYDERSCVICIAS